MCWPVLVAQTEGVPTAAGSPINNYVLVNVVPLEDSEIKRAPKTCTSRLRISL